MEGPGAFPAFLRIVLLDFIVDDRSFLRLLRTGLAEKRISLSL